MTPTVKRTITREPGNLTSPVCAGCSYCTACIITNTDTTLKGNYNDTITGYVCKNPKRCGADRKEITVTPVIRCPFEEQPQRWTATSRQLLIDENTRLRIANNTLTRENENLKSTINDKDEAINMFIRATNVVSAVYNTAYTIACNAAQKADGIDVDKEKDKDNKAENEKKGDKNTSASKTRETNQ